MPDAMKKAIQSVIIELMERVMTKVLVEDPFKSDLHRASRPLYAALVPDEIFKGSHFERRFVTPFGGVWEKLAQVAATEGMGLGTLGKRITGNVKQERLRRITEVLNWLEHGERKTRKRPNWKAELEYVLKGRGKNVPVTVISDVYVEDTKRKTKYAVELKAPLPNSDQTKVSKEKMLKLYAMEPLQVNAAFYALPYNPFGRREDYDWSFPARWFDMKNDEVVLIGDEFWEKIGGTGTYRVFIDAINEIGEAYRERIYREYLGIDPPAKTPIKL